MTGTLASVASLTICLAMTNAFVVRVPKATPPSGSAWKKQASESVGLPLANDGRSPGASGNAFSRIGGNDAVESSGQRLPWMPFGGGYGALCRAGTGPLHVSKGTQPEITQDGNVTVPIVGGVEGVEGGSTKPYNIGDSNATVPIIVGGVDGGEGGGSGVASVPQNEVVVQHNCINVTLEEVTSHEYFGEEQSVTVIDSSSHESASATQADDEDSTHGVSDDADLAIDTILTTDSDLATDADIATVIEVTTDDDLDRQNHEQLSRGASSDIINDEAGGTTSDDIALDEEVAFELTADGVASDTSLIAEDAVDDGVGFALKDTEDSASGEELPLELTADGVTSEASLTVQDAVDGTMESVPPHGIDDRVIYEEMSFEAADNDVIDTMSSTRLDPDNPDNAAHDDVGSVPDNPYNGFYDLMGTTEDDDEISDKAIPRTVFFGGNMDDLVWSLLQDALARGLLDSKHLILDPILDHLMWSKLYDAISGRGESELALALDNMRTSLLHDAFFGPTASKAVTALARKADDSVLVVNDYANAVADLYAKFKRGRDRAATNQAPTDVARSGLIDQMNIWLFGPEFADYAVDLKMACVLHFSEEHRFNPAAADLIDEKSIWPFDPGMVERAAADAPTPKLYEDTSDGAATADEVFYNDPVNDLVFAVVCDTLAKGTAFKGLVMLNPVMDKLMRSKLHEALTGRAAVESESLADALDEMVTCLLHDAFFGPKAFKTVAKIAKSADNSKLVVDQYIESVIAQYAKFKEARGSIPDSEAPAVRKAGKRAGGWLKKLWRKIRRKKR